MAVVHTEWPSDPPRLSHALLHLQANNPIAVTWDPYNFAHEVTQGYISVILWFAAARWHAGCNPAMRPSVWVHVHAWDLAVLPLITSQFSCNAFCTVGPQLWQQPHAWCAARCGLWAGVWGLRFGRAAASLPSHQVLPWFAEPSTCMPKCLTSFPSYQSADYCGDKAWGDPNPIDYCIPTDNNCVQPWVGVLPKCTGPVTAFGGGPGTM